MGRYRSSVAAMLVSAILMVPACQEEGDVGPRQNCLDVSQVVTLGDISDPVSITSDHVDVAGLRGTGWVAVDMTRPAEPLLYREDGRFVGPLLRRGEGPGEAYAAGVLSTDPWDSLWISDRRGKVLVTGPAGQFAREITHFDHDINGFDTLGRGYSVRVQGVEADTAVPYARVWNREGDSVAVLGPGSAEQWSAGRSVPVRRPAIWLESDTLALASIAPPAGVLLERWIRTERQTLLSTAEAWRTLDSGEVPEGIRLAGIIVTPSQAILALARIEDLDPEREDDLARRVGGAQSIEAVHQDGAGFLLRAPPSAGNLKAVFLNQTPAGFIDSGHYYTAAEDSTGLIVITIWRITDTCGS